MPAKLFELSARASVVARAQLCSTVSLVALVAAAIPQPATAQVTGATGQSGGTGFYNAATGNGSGGAGGLGGAAGDGSGVAAATGTGGMAGSTAIGSPSPSGFPGTGASGGAGGNAGIQFNVGGRGGGSDSGGGGGGTAGNASGGGGGGGGGAGRVLTGTLNNTTATVGGIGGPGGGASGGFFGFNVGGGGGAGGGGSGVLVTTGTSITNSSTIRGGQGGLGHSGHGSGFNPATDFWANGAGGGGGNGITATSSTGLTITNTGTIEGGQGWVDAFSNQPGDGGVGIIGQNLTIINSGTIAGGQNGFTANFANAINVTGGTNSIQMLGGNVGAILLSAGSTDISGTFTSSLTASGGTTLSVNNANATGITTLTNLGAVSIGAGRTLSANAINNNGGSISVGTGATLQGTGNTLNNSATINVATGGAITDAGAINNFGIINFNGPGGTATLSSGTNTISNAGGQINVVSGDVSVSGNIGNSGTVSLTGGNMSGVGTFSTSGTVNVAATYMLGVQTFTMTGGSVTGTGTISASTAFNLSGGSIGTVLAGTAALTNTAGTTILTGTNTYTGGTTISAGTLQLGAGGTAGSIVGGVTNNGTLAFNRSDALTFGGAISGTGAVVQSGTGTTVFTGTNTYSGSTTISAGTLQIGNGGTSGSLGSGNVVNNATLAINRSDGITVGNLISGSGGLSQLGGGTTILTGDNTYLGGTLIATGILQIGNGGTSGAIGAGNVTNNGTLAVNRNDTFTLGNVISGTGSLQQIGSGTTILTGLHTYSGGTTITGGTLQLGNGGAAGLIGAGNVTNDSALAVNHSGLIVLGNAISGTGALQLIGSGTTVLTGHSTYTGGTTITAGALQVGIGGTGGSIVGDVSNNGALVLNRSNAFALAGNISGTGTVAKQGFGTTTLTGTNTYTGGTTISGGTLQLGDGGTAGSIVGNVTNDATLAFNRSDALTLSGAISGTGAVVQSGTGTTVLTGNNTYSGSTTINAGALQIGVGGTSGSLGTGNVINNATLAFNRSDSTTVGNLISGSGGLSQLGTGATILTGDNTYLAGTLIAAGTLQVGAGGTTGTLGAGNVTNNGALAFNRSDAISFSGNISGTGAFAQLGGGTTTLTGTNTYTGGTTITAGTLQIGNGGTAGTIAGNVTNNGALAFNRSDAVTFAGTISGTGSVEQKGSGVTVLAGNNTYAGGTTVSGGTLSLGHNNAAGTGAITTTGSVIDYVNGVSIGNQVIVSSNTTQLQVLSGTAEQAGVISQSGGARPLEKIGAGALFLSANNTYSGPTTISQGALVLGNGGASGSINGNVAVAAGAMLAFNRSDTFGFAGTITGAGNVVQAGSGTAVFGNGMSYTGQTQILAGTLQIGNGGTTGSIGAGAILNDATLAINRSDAFALANNISGIGQLQHNGSGTTTLSGSNSYSGATAVNAGTLQAGAVNTFSANSAHAVAAFATLDLNGFSQAIGSLAGLGNVTLGAATLTAGGNNASTTFAGVISGTGGLAKAGLGTLTLSGINTYTGPTSVNGGILEIATGGSIVSDVTLNGGLFVNNGASLGTQTIDGGGVVGGNGTFGNTTINNGILSPGNSIGMITIQGNLVLTSASTYLVEIDPLTSDRTNVTGTATLGGATVSALYASGSYVSKRYTILTASGGVIGTFNTLVNTNLPANFTPKLSYDPNNAYLELELNFTPAPPTSPTPPTSPSSPPTPPSYAGVLTTNQAQVAKGLNNSFNVEGGIPLLFGLLSPSGLTQVSGEAATGVQQTTFDAMDRFLNVLVDPFAGERGGGARQAIAGGDAYAAIVGKSPPRAPTFERRWSAWAAGYGGTQSTDGDDAVGSQRTTSRIFGSAAGSDYRIGMDTIVGIAMGGAGTSYHLANGLGGGSSEMFQAGIYGRHSFGAAYVAGALAYGWQDITTNRIVFLNSLRASFDAHAVSGRLEAGYRFTAPLGGVTPYAAGQFTTFFVPDYAEQVIAGVNTFALAYASKDVTAARSELGFRADTSLALATAILTLRGRAAWAHNFNVDRSVGVAFQTLPASGFVVSGASPARDAALVTASAETKWLNGFSVAASFEGEFSKVTASYAGKGTIRYVW